MAEGYPQADGRNAGRRCDGNCRTDGRHRPEAGGAGVFRRVGCAEDGFVQSHISRGSGSGAAVGGNPGAGSDSAKADVAISWARKFSTGVDFFSSCIRGAVTHGALWGADNPRVPQGCRHDERNSHVARSSAPSQAGSGASRARCASSSRSRPPSRGGPSRRSWSPRTPGARSRRPGGRALRRSSQAPRRGARTSARLRTIDSNRMSPGPGVDCGPAARCPAIDSKPLPLKNSGHGL